MSHAATNWLATIAPARMTHGEFRVLFHLCDCHNPSMGCFPSQEYLREHTGLSNGGLNKALASLEEKALLRRERDRDQRTHRQKSTRYILGFEMSAAQEPSPLSGAGAVSTSDPDPSPLGARPDSTTVESHIEAEPVKEPVKEPCAAGATEIGHDVLDEAVTRFLAAYPRNGVEARVRDAMRAALAQGVACDTIVAAARSYADEQAGNSRRYIAYPENWLERRGWERHAARLRPGHDPDAGLKAVADLILSGKSFLCRHVTSASARELVRRGVVTAEQCKAVEVSL